MTSEFLEQTNKQPEGVQKMENVDAGMKYNFKKYGPEEMKTCEDCGFQYPECYDNDRKAIAYDLHESGQDGYIDEFIQGCPKCYNDKQSQEKQ